MPFDGLLRQVVFLPAFEIDATEVTRAEYAECVDAGRCSPPARTDDPHCNWPRPDRHDHPINCVSFQQAEAFCRQDSRRLPSEHEWEAAARASGIPTMPLGLFPRACNRGEAGDYALPEPSRSAPGTCPVGQDAEAISQRGLHDFSGNVSEYTTDHFCGDSTPRCQSAVVRGTAWRGHLYEEFVHRWPAPDPGHLPRRPPEVIVPDRGRAPSEVGFRCARSLTESSAGPLDGSTR